MIDANIPAIVYQRTGSFGAWTYQFVAGRTAEILGVPAHEAFGPAGLDPSARITTPIGNTCDSSYLAAVRNGGGAWSAEFRIRRRAAARSNGCAPPSGSRPRTVRDAFDRRLLDVTQEKLRGRTHPETRYDRDVLTALYSRDYFERAVALALERFAVEASVRRRQLSIDDFQRINDALGIEAGDRLLRLSPTPTLAAAPEAHVVARLGGHKFGVLAEIADPDAAPRSPADRQEPRAGAIAWERTRSRSRSARVAPCRGFAPRATDLMHDAGSALERARAEGGRLFRLYADEMTPESVMRVTIREALREALERDEFTLVYQPQIELATGRLPVARR